MSLSFCFLFADCNKMSIRAIASCAVINCHINLFSIFTDYSEWGLFFRIENKFIELTAR